MQMKRTLLGSVVGLALIASAGAHAQDRKVTIGVSIPAADHGWTGGVVFHAERMKALLEKQHPGLRIIVKTSPDGASQANALEDFVSQKIDALVVLPQNSDELTSSVGSVKAKGIFVTVVDRGLKDASFQDIYVAGNNPELGRISAEYMKKALPSGGDIVVLRGIPTVIDDQRVKAFEDAIAGSKIKVLDKQFANWNRDDGFKVMQDFLAKYKKIDAVWAQDDDIAVGVLEAIKQSKRDDIKFVIGGAGMKDMVKRVMDGDKMIPVDVLYPPAMIGTAMELTAAQFYNQVPVRGTYIVGAPLITKDNAKEYYFPDSPF
jgi:ribose transport system substrate-binding protein